MAFDEPDETKLIDVSELPQEPEDSAELEPTAAAAIPEATTPPPVTKPPAGRPLTTPPSAAPGGGTRLATLGERFAALCIDLGVVWALYWAQVQLYYQIREGHWGGPAPTNLGMDGLIFHTIALLATFLYFFLAEGIFASTIGKGLCALSVRRHDGHIASFSAIFLRNFFRPLDLLCLPALMAMEFTTHQQRVGDLAAGTIVIARQRKAPHNTPLAWDALATSTGRIMAEAMNLAIILMGCAATVLLLSDRHPFVSQWMIIAGPMVLLLLWSFVHAIAETTPGDWLCGYRVVQENGAQMGFVHAFLRTLWMPVDLLVGFFALALSPRRQRCGDLVAGTLVIRERRHVAGGIALLLIVGLLGGLALLGLNNPSTWVNRHLRLSDPRSWINQDFQLTFMPRTELAPNFPAVRPALAPFRIVDFRFAVGRPENTRAPATYIPGETAFFIFELEGFHLRDNKVWIQQDLGIKYPDGTFGYRQENIIDHHQIKREPGPLVLKNVINLSQTIPVGQYGIYITVRDKIGGGAPLVHTETFYVKPQRPEPLPVHE
ncbi:MAG: RDD family protein [Deltaproteobacteria bacterium]|nr:RDD family protein [Deltaproteobacteria bacterium]